MFALADGWLAGLDYERFKKKCLNKNIKHES